MPASSCATCSCPPTRLPASNRRDRLAHARNAHAAAEQHGIAKVYDTWEELLDDPAVELVDIAYPPAGQLEIVRAACARTHIKGILAQKPLASTLEDAIEIEKVCRESGTVIVVNQNMRYDQSIRALKTLLDGRIISAPRPSRRSS